MEVIPDKFVSQYEIKSDIINISDKNGSFEGLCPNWSDTNNSMKWLKESINTKITEMMKENNPKEEPSKISI